MYSRQFSFLFPNINDLIARRLFIMTLLSADPYKPLSFKYTDADAYLLTSSLLARECLSLLLDWSKSLSKDTGAANCPTFHPQFEIVDRSLEIAEIVGAVDRS
jgi:hypothetical protein